MPEASNKALDIEDIFHTYKHKIYRLALSMTKDAREAEDVVQDVFLKLIKKIDTFKGKSSLSTWIYKIAYNEALMHLREKRKLKMVTYSDYKEPRRANKDIGLFINWPALPDAAGEEHELKAAIDRAVALMLIKYRMVLLLRTLEGLSVKDTAKILRLKENSVKSRLHRARLIIHKELTSYMKASRLEPPEKEDRFCNTATRFIYDYAEGRLDIGRQSGFRKHIADCRECNIFLDTYTKAITITKALQCADLPQELQDKIKTFIAQRD